MQQDEAGSVVSKMDEDAHPPPPHFWLLPDPEKRHIWVLSLTFQKQPSNAEWVRPAE